MPSLADLTLVDLVVALLVVGAVVGALRRTGRPFAALGSGLATLVVVWLASVALVAWAPGPLSNAVADSRFAHATPYPHRAVAQAEALLGHPDPHQEGDTR